MGDDIRPPVLWRRPNARTYSYNQEFGGSYYRPMIEYIDTKNRQGVFFEPPTERIHLPDCAETYMKRGEPRSLQQELCVAFLASSFHGLLFICHIEFQIPARKYQSLNSHPF